VAIGGLSLISGDEAISLIRHVIANRLE